MKERKKENCIKKQDSVNVSYSSKRFFIYLECSQKFLIFGMISNIYSGCCWIIDWKI